MPDTFCGAGLRSHLPPSAGSDHTDVFPVIPAFLQTRGCDVSLSLTKASIKPQTLPLRASAVSRHHTPSSKYCSNLHSPTFLSAAPSGQ